MRLDSNGKEYEFDITEEMKKSSDFLRGQQWILQKKIPSENLNVGDVVEIIRKSTADHNFILFCDVAKGQTKMVKGNAVNIFSIPDSPDICEVQEDEGSSLPVDL